MKMKNLLYGLFGYFILAVTFSACKEDTPPVKEEQPTPYDLVLPGNWPMPNILAENPLTVEGVALGRKLFYESLISGNGTQSCASCHQQSSGFVDANKQFSIGSEGDIGIRNAQPLFNLNWSKGYFWDGRRRTLEDLIQEPIEAANEMNLTIDSAVARLKNHPEYPGLFNKAFPAQGLTVTTLKYAMAQFIRTIISGNTKWDEYFQANPRNPEKLMTPAQARGYIAFISEEKGDCFHCHNPFNPFLINSNEREFANNGLDANPDTGFFKVTGNPNDWGKFKTASLRNLSYTAPYMHDGRFATLMEVLEHYNTGFKYSPTTDAVLITKHGDPDNNYKPIPRLTQQDKEDIIEFLKLLDDPNLESNPKWSNPN